MESFNGLPENCDLLWPVEEYESVLSKELEFLKIPVLYQNSSFLCIQSEPPVIPVWWKAYWKNARVQKIQSIGDAVRFLRSQGGVWTPYFLQDSRRTQLIASELRSPKGGKIPLGKILPDGKMGGFTLMSHDELLYSSDISPNIAGERMEFSDDEAAPSRAHLKIWEALTRLRKFPGKGSLVADFGSSPGGWTRALAMMGCEVYSYDKAELDPAVMALPNVHFEKRDIFKIKPQELPKLEWFFSDVIAYPEKLREFVLGLMAAGTARNYVVTIKFQGQTDFSALQKWRDIPGSLCVHLQANKHELTWILLS